MNGRSAKQFFLSCILLSETGDCNNNFVLLLSLNVIQLNYLIWEWGRSIESNFNSMNKIIESSNLIIYTIIKALERDFYMNFDIMNDYFFHRIPPFP